MDDWFAVYRESDGELVSIGTVVADPLRAGLAKKLLTGEPRRLRWNASSLEFETPPPPPAQIDRVDEFMADLSFNMNQARRAELRDALIALLGSRRFRDTTERPNL